MRFKYLLHVLLICFLSACDVEEDKALRVTDGEIAALELFHSEKKFTVDSSVMYPGAPDESTRLRAENIINNLANRLIQGVKNNPSKAYVLNQFELSLKELQGYDSEERDRASLYLEDIMDILSIDSSDGTLNRWRYGFEPA